MLLLFAFSLEHTLQSLFTLCNFVKTDHSPRGFCGRAEELACSLVLGRSSSNYPFAEEVPGSLSFPSGAHSCFSECFRDSCSQPSVAQSGMLLQHIWIGIWWLGLRGLSASLVLSLGALPSAGLRGQWMQLWMQPAFHKLAEITCLIWNNSLAFPVLRQTLELTEIRFCSVCVYICALSQMNCPGGPWLRVAQSGFLGRDLHSVERDE